MSTAFSLDRYPIAFMRPRVSFPYAWVGHIPFAYVLMDLLRPEMFVELGTDSGNSYLAFCQAVSHLGLDTQCVAVDSWQGDEHARLYGNNVYENLRAYHDPLYGRFSRLKRAYFDDALASFEDGSIELLHIDGLHTYEAVRHDFETWLPKMRPGAVVLFHDSAISDREFGVGRFLDELEANYRIFRFRHSNGLGILQLGPSNPDFDSFMEYSCREPERVRAYFEGIAGTLIDADTGDPLEGVDATEQVECKIFYRMHHEGHDESRSISRSIPIAATGQRAEVTFELPDGLRPDFLRIDPADAPGVFGISTIELRAVSSRLVIDLGPERLASYNGDLLPAQPECAIRMATFHDDPWFEVNVRNAMEALPVTGPVELTLHLEYQAVLHVPAMRRLAQEEGRLLDEIRSERITHDSFKSLHAHFEYVDTRHIQTISALQAQVEHLDARLAAVADQQQLHHADFRIRVESWRADLNERDESWIAEMEARQRAEAAGLRQATTEAITQVTQAMTQGVAVLRDDIVNVLSITEENAHAIRQIMDQTRRGHLRNRLRLYAGMLFGRKKAAASGRNSLIPTNLILLDEGDGKGGWASDGGDPQFSIQPLDGNDAFPGGWYLFEADIEVLDGDMVAPCLYPDYGYGATEADRIDLPTPDPKGKLRMVVCLRQRAITVRFDPSIAPLTFRMDRFAFKRIGRFTALLQMGKTLGEHSGNRTQAASLRAVALRTALRSGVRAAGEAAHRNYRAGMHVNGGSYTDWIHRFEMAELSPKEAIIEGPLISLVLPVYDTPDKWLRRCIDSVLAQTYRNWELCVVDDASSAPNVWKTLQSYQRDDARIRIAKRETNGHISETSNSALELASGDWIGLLDHDDELAPMALQIMVESIRRHPEWRIVYSDEDKIDERGERFAPYFKPDFNYELLLGQNFVCHFSLYDAALVRAVGGFRKGFEGSQDWDLILRCVEQIDPSQIGHVPRVLYHWRAISGSTASGIGEKNYAALAGQRAVQDHLNRTGQDAQVRDIGGGRMQVIRALPNQAPRVSLIIPTRDKLELLRPCVQSILEKTEYPDYEILIVDNQSSEPETLAYFEEVSRDARVRVLHYDAPFNYSAINNYAANMASGDIIGLINNDIEVIDGDWLQIMALEAVRAGVGAVGAMLLYPNDTIQHAGVVLGLQGVAAHVYCGQPHGIEGQMGRARLMQAMSAVTAACLLVRKSVFDSVGGLDEQLKVAFNDIDFCLRVREAGYHNVWTPFAVLYHHESASRGYEDTPEKRQRFEGEVKFMFERWGDLLRADPTYNPNLSLTGEPFTLAFPPRTHSF